MRLQQTYFPPTIEYWPNAHEGRGCSPGPEDESSRERARIYHVLRNLLEYLGCRLWPHSAFGHVTSHTREDLVCELADIQSAIPTLPPRLRQVISFVGLQCMNDYEAADKLGVSHKTVKNWLWRAAELIQSWRRRPI